MSESPPRRSWADRAQAYLLLLPSMLLIAGIALVPVAVAVWLSLYRRILVFHVERFIGFGNYRFLLHDPRFWTALGNTTYFALLSVAFEVSLGLCFALLLDARAARPGLLRASILVPWAIPTAISAKLWAWLFNPEYGLITHALPGREINWLGTPGYAMHAAILVDVWKTTPFVTLLLLASLRSIPEDVYRAARIDGASPFRTFVSITLPLLKPAIALTLVFRTLDGFRVFDSIFVLTAGGPANTTETLSIYTYKTLMDSGQFGYGSALAVATFLVILAISVVYLKLLGPESAP